MLDRLEESGTTLAQFPLRGVSREEVLPSLRSHAVGNYVIFYLPLEDGIDIVRVLPGMRDMDALF